MILKFFTVKSPAGLAGLFSAVKPANLTICRGIQRNGIKKYKIICNISYRNRKGEVSLGNVEESLNEDVKREAAILRRNYEKVMRELGVGKSVLFPYVYQAIVSQKACSRKAEEEPASFLPDNVKKREKMSNAELKQYINTLEGNLLYLEKRHKAIIDNVKGVIFQTDTAGCCTFLSPAWTKITGFSIEESLKNPFVDYVYIHDKELHHKQFQVILAKKRAYSRYEIRYLTKKGDFRWFEVYVRFIVDEYGNVSGTLGTMYDITIQRKTEKMLDLAYELRRRSHFLNNIVMGKTIVDQKVKEGMHTLGIDFSRPLVCCLLVNKEPVDREKEKNAIIEALEEENGCIAWICGNDIGILYQQRNDGYSLMESSQKFAHSFLEKVHCHYPQLTFVIGVSNSQEGANCVRKAYWQGWSATVAAQCQGKKTGVFHYKDLGILQLLIKNIGNEGADEFIKEQIGNLISHDKEKGTNFLLTLEEILQNSSMKKTAEKMFLHPKTVVFRKHRIERILGVSLDSFETRLALGVALKLYTVMQVAMTD